MSRKIQEYINSVPDGRTRRALEQVFAQLDTEVDAARTAIIELIDDADTLVTWQTEVDGDLDTINDGVHYRNNRDGVIGGNHTMGVGTTDTTMVRLSGTVRYRISGVEYSATNVEGDFAGTADVTANGNGAWRILIGKTGALTTQRATANGTTGAMNFAAAEDALLSLSQIAITASCVEVGYLMLHATNGQAGFTPQTDDPAATDANVDVATYYNCRAPRIDNGLTADPSVGLSEGTNDDEYAFGTINVKTNGVNVAQIAADTTIAFADADVITTSGKYGGELFVTDLAGTAVMSLASTGIAGGAQTVDIASAAAANTALDAVQAALPTLFTVIGRVTVLAKKATFTFNTDDLAGTDGTATWTDESAAAFNRTVTSGAGVGIVAPTIPATVAAPINVAVSAPDPSEALTS